MLNVALFLHDEVRVAGLYACRSNEDLMAL
jgi:hypothetical protein